jgi:hypothetical protein
MAVPRRGSSRVGGRPTAALRSATVPCRDMAPSPTHKKNRGGRKTRGLRGVFRGGVAEGWFRMDPRQWPTCLTLVLMSGHHPRGLLCR